MESDGGTATIIGGGINLFFVGELPAPVGFMLAVKLSGPPQDWEGQFRLGFKILDTTATAIREEEFEIGGQFGPELFPGPWERGGILATAHQFEVSEAGPYSLEILIDDEPKHSVPFFVHLGPPPTAPPSVPLPPDANDEEP